MIYETRYNLEGELCNIRIEYVDDTLHNVTIDKRNNVLKIKYVDDEVLDCVMNDHEMRIEHNRFVDNIGGTQYNNGYIVVDDIGLVYNGNVQLLANEVFYKGIHVKTYDLFTIDSDLNVMPKYTYSEDILFLLSMANGNLVPYYHIPNLPGIGLREFVTALGEMLKQGVYLTYMDKIFGGYPSQLIMDSNTDLLDKDNTTYIKAVLDSCSMEMTTTNSYYKALIIDGDGIVHERSSSQ